MTIPTLNRHLIKGCDKIEKLYNIKVKQYGKEKQITVYEKPVVTGFNSQFKGLTKEQIIKKPTTINEFKVKALKSYRSAKIRSKNKIYDYSRSNEWDWFVTITFDPQKVESKNYSEVSKKLSNWIDRTKRRYAPNMKYVFVPELHKSGRYHFHGLISDCETLEFTDSGHKTNTGDIIYNIGKYTMGFTTATKVKDSTRVTKYIGKYITKELASMVKGKKRYWASRNCKLPDIEYYYNEVKKETKQEVLRKLHDDLISQNGFVYGSQRDVISLNGNENFIRYYEFVEG